MEYLVHLAIIFSIFAILAMSLNLIVGYTGMVSIAHASIFGIGAYCTALLMKNVGFNFFLGAIVSVVVCGFAALVLGVVLSKFKDDLFVLGSVGFNIIVTSIMFNWESLTRGPLGISGIGKPALFGISFSDNDSFLVLSLLFLLGIYLLSEFIVNSSFGRVLKAIREDELVARVFGYNVFFYKLAIFVIGACMASVAGSLFAVYISYIDPTSFISPESILILSMIVLGGLASLKGSLLGALFLVLLPEVLRFVGFPSDLAGHMRLLIYGLLLVIFMFYRPKGLLGEYRL